MHAPAPILTTARLTLRPFRAGDFDAFAALMESERAQYMGGPMPRRRAWAYFAADAGSWPLLGHGGWSVDLTGTAETIGQVGLNRPDHFPELELGWCLYDGFEGQGYAHEAALAARAWAFANLGLTTLVSYVSPGNARSVALAERLGAVRDPSVAGPDPEDMVFRHPAPGGPQ